MYSCSLVVWNTIVSRISFGHEKNWTFEHFSKTLLNDLSNFPPAEWKMRPCYSKQFFLQLATQRWRIKNLSSCRGDATRTQLVSQRCEKWRVVLLFLQPATQELQLQNRVLHVSFFFRLATNVCCVASCKKNFSRNMAFKESTQWYKFFFYVATAIVTAVYHKNVTKNMD